MERSSIPLQPDTQHQLASSKNLLAFSGGVDSTALFFLLLENNIKFDIAIVDYGIRESSKEEVAYAQLLAAKYNKQCYIHRASLASSNFEHEARKVRYHFFETIILQNDYHTLLTAHQLNDKVEWFLMQMAKGAGLVEMLGFEAYETREKYTLVRPLMQVTKEKLLHYLNENQIHYFVDATNFDQSIKRNAIRHRLSDPFLQNYEQGIIKSFAYLEHDKEKLFKLEVLFHEQDLYVAANKNDAVANIRTIDKILKKLGILLTKSQRDEIIKNRDVVISGKIAVVIEDEKIYIAPFTQCVMEKPFKEKCRILKIPHKIRPYLYQEAIDPNQIR